MASEHQLSAIGSLYEASAIISRARRDTDCLDFTDWMVCLAPVWPYLCMWQVDAQIAAAAAFAKQHGGVSGGEENGRAGYNVTMAIAYIADFMAEQVRFDV